MLKQPDMAGDNDSVAAARFPVRLLTVNLVLTIVIFTWFGWIVFDARRDVESFTGRVSRLEDLRGVITHLDEVLTMSARMAATSGDLRWEERYRQFEPQLDAAIKETISLAADPAATVSTTSTDAANVKLVAMENQAFALIRAGRREAAQQVLASPEYETLKKLYAAGETSFINQIRREFDDNLRNNQRLTLLLTIAALIVGGISFLAWFLAVRAMRRWRLTLERSLSERGLSEGALRESEERYRELFENARDAIYVHDLKGTYVSANLAAQKLSGYSLDQIIGKNFVNFLAPEFAVRMRTRLAQPLPAHADATYEVEMITRDRRRVPVEVRSRLIYEKGIAVGVQGIVRDITERKRAGAERQAISEIVQGIITTSNLDELFALAHQAISRLLPARNCFVALYDKTTGVLNIPFCRDEFDAIAAPQKLGRGLTAYVLRSGCPMLLSPELIHELVSKGEVELVGTLPAAWLGAPLRTSTDIIGVLVVQHYEDKDAYSQRDLELLASVGDQLGLAIERKQVEIELKTNERRLNEAQHIARLGSWEWDVATNSVRWSDELYRIFGLQSHELGSTFGKFLTFVHPDDRELAKAAIERALQYQVFPDCDYRIIRPDGLVTVVQCKGEVIVDETGRVASMWGTVQDISERKRAEEDLRASEIRFQSAFDRAPTGVTLASKSGRFLRANESFCALVGYTEEELLVLDFQAITHPDDVAESREALRQLLAGELTTIQVDKRYVHKLGHEVFAQTNVSMVRDAQDEPLYFVSQSQDIGERKRAEAERLVIAEIVEGVLTTATLDELFALAHHSISKLLSAENLFIGLDDTTTGLMHFEYWVDKHDSVPLPRPVIKGFSGYVMRTGRPLLPDEELKSQLYGAGGVDRSGTVSASWLGVPLRTRSRTIGVLVVQDYEKENAYSQRDLEFLGAVGDQLGLAIERKQIEIELKTNELQLTAAQHIAHIGSWEWDNVKGKLHWSDELFRIFGRPSQDLKVTFKDYLKYIHPEDRKLVMGSIRQVLGGGEFPEFDYRVIRPDGTLRTLQVNSKGIADATGRITRMWGTTQDITDRKRAENEREVMSEVIQSVNLTANLDELLTLIHQALSKVVYAENCFVALYDKETELFSRCFYVDQLTPDAPPQKLRKSCSAYVYRTGRPLLMNEAVFQGLLAKGEVEVVGAPAPSWLGVPLKTASETLGVLVVQHYDKADVYSEQDVKFLTSVGSQIALAIERKRAEEALIESDKRFRDLFYDAPVGYHELDTEGRITGVNTTELSMLGYASEEMIGHHVWEFIEEAEVARQTFAEKLVGTKALGSIERAFRRKDGTFMEVQLDDQMLHDPSGQITGIRATMQDITERKQTERALKDSEVRFRDLFENASDLVCTLDLEGNYTSLNKSGERLTGYTQAEAVKINLAQVVTPQAVAMVQEMMKRKFDKDVTTTYEIDFTRKDGGTVTLEVSSRLLHQHGKETGIQAIGRDITQRKQVEAELARARDAALESVRLKSEFLANMSHEIRTPMNGVIGMTDLLLDTDLSSPQREYTETIQSSADALLTIIDDILDFSKIEAGLLRFDTIDFELRGTVEAPVELLAERAQAKGLELASLVYRDVPTALRGDPGRLRQVLTNLLGNAVKFTERGEVVVSVTKVSESATEAMLRFEIQDTGIGISVEAQRGLFRAFIQADGSTTRKYGGTGLGLAISKQLVELMGGEIGIESMPRVGSTFWFTAKFEKQVMPEPTQSETVGNLPGARVLIVDDNSTNRGILNHQTNSWGMIVTEADSGKRALELLRAGATEGQPYDIAILDLLMPEMNGFELAEAIKADPSIASVALVLLPSFGKRGHGEKARQAGIAAYLQKPVRQQKLYDCLTKVLAGSFDSEPVTPAALVTRHTLRETAVQQKEKTFSNVRIIVAEDNIVNQKVALRQLYSLGYHAEAVDNGKELLKMLETADFDLILMDCQMPEMDGFAATAAIRQREGIARHTTIIAMTANAIEGDDERCLAAGMDDYLSKPVRVEVLRQKVERWTRPAESGASDTVLSDRHSEFTRPESAVVVANGKRRSEVIDRTQLVSLRAIQQHGEADLVTELIDLFLSEASSHLEALRAAALREDVVEIQRVAHRLQGSSANLGAMKMSALSQALDTSDPSEDRNGLLAQLEIEFELVREALNAERRELEDDLVTPLAGT